MINEVLVVYAIVDDLLKAIGHQEDVRMQMSDAEIITSAIIAAMFFGGNQLLTCRYMREHKLMPRMLSKSRFNRRLHRGYIASKKRYFYGVKVHLLTTRSGIPVEFAILPGEANDTRGLSSLSLNLPAGSEIYADAGYTDYLAEDDLAASEQISLKG